MTKQDLKEFFSSRTNFFDKNAYPIIEISGEEHREWLHRISSQTSIDLPPLSLCRTAFLSALGGPHGYFQMLILPDKVWILAEPQNKDSILKYLDFSHFGEAVEFKTIYLESYYEVVGQAAVDLSRSSVLQVEEGAYIIAAEDWNRTGAIYLNVKLNAKPNVKPSETTHELDERLYHALKRSRGWPIDQIDISEQNVLLEAAPLSAYATDTKGCYPGQEVIAKVYTYGRVARKYIPLFSKALPQRSEIYSGDEKVGIILATYELDDGYLLFSRVLRSTHDKFLENKASLSADGQNLSLF